MIDVVQDLSADDLKLELYLVCTVIRVGAMELSKDSKDKNLGFFRRPLACAGFDWCKCIHHFLTRMQCCR